MAITDQLSEMVFPLTGSTGSTEAMRSITPGASPFKYTATSRQALHITGGSITAISYARGPIVLALGLVTGGQLLELNAGDAVTITYLTTPTLTVIPR
ncbi:hypothetical protein GIY62_14775 [Burkholderia plantarii]|uniref:hypothetical protein n=1 Tax=Burkholderia plantarii TaxID=41899 RepID=UPI00272C9806|nr:hypothetical protein [Burkholderia plantarii]WLE58391.1 hypothetical protein GIY62_14775 [Burkholderia plantarii]